MQNKNIFVISRYKNNFHNLLDTSIHDLNILTSHEPFIVFITMQIVYKTNLMKCNSTDTTSKTSTTHVA